ncbi:hypothetical protein H0H92_003953 [Tricholoma furcatifolium]|nr:hypothetical protein H0H92_003953 [Tricholoma furcatifolium]
MSIDKLLDAVKKHTLKLKRSTRSVTSNMERQDLLCAYFFYKPAIPDGTSVIITASATGEGIHTHWIYPEDDNSVSDSEALVAGSAPSSATVLDSSNKHESLAITIPSTPRKQSAIKISASTNTRADNRCGTPMVVSTSETGLGVHRRWCYPQNVTQPQEKLVIRIPQRLHFADDEVPTEQVKHTITTPACKKRVRSGNGDDNVFTRRKRTRSSKAIMAPTKGVGELIYNGLDTYAQPIVVTTSDTGQGTHTRWLQDDSSSSVTQTSDPNIDDVADNKVSSSGSTSDYEVVATPATSSINSLKSLKRSRDGDASDDEDKGYFIRRTRSRRVFAPLSPASTFRATLSACSNPGLRSGVSYN